MLSKPFPMCIRECFFIWLFPNVSQSEKQSIWGVIEQITVAVLLDAIRRMTCRVLKK